MNKKWKIKEINWYKIKNKKEIKEIDQQWAIWKIKEINWYKIKKKKSKKLINNENTSDLKNQRN